MIKMIGCQKGKQRRQIESTKRNEDTASLGHLIGAKTKSVMTNQSTTLGALATVFRFEYICATLPGLTITFFLCAKSPGEFVSRPVLEGLAIVALVVFSCLGINSIADFKIDQQYKTAKNRIPVAIGKLGLSRIRTIIVLLNLIALALTVDLCREFKSLIPLWLILADAFFAYGYSLPGMQFKLRGVISHAVSLAMGTCVIPFVLSMYTYLGTVPASLGLFIVGFAVVQYGFEFANQSLDYLQDRDAGLKTPAVRLGVVGALRAGIIVPVSGILIVFSALLLMYVEAAREIVPPKPDWIVLIAWLSTLFPLIAGYRLPIHRTWKMLRLCRDQPPESCVPLLPGLCHYWAWQASSVTGVALSAAAYWIVINNIWAP